MRNLHVVIAVAAFGCNNKVIADLPDADVPADAAPTSDAPDAPAARCDLLKDFGAATPVAGVGTATSFTLTRDERIAITANQNSLFVASRASATDAFGGPSQAQTAAVNAVAGSEDGPSISADGLTLYFGRRATTGEYRIFVATRATTQAAFSPGDEVFADGVGLEPSLFAPTISDDGQTLYWVDGNDATVHAATRSTTIEFTNQRVVSTALMFTPPVLTSDELTMFYRASNGGHILVSTRASKTEMFGVGVPVPNVNSLNDNDYPAYVSHDGCVLYLFSARPGGSIWEAHRPK